MASSVFYQFHVNKCVVDSELLDHFSGSGWKLKENEDSFFTKYGWPDIKLSKSILQDPEYKFKIELLGCYQPENDCLLEGTVYLYYETLKDAAERYIYETGSTTSLEKVIDRLTTIVLIHEFVHWLMHYVSHGASVRIRYKKFGELEFHEGFAQIFTHWFAHKKGGLYFDIFIWLVKKQPPQYHAYTKLLGIGVKTPSHAITLLSICKLLDIQSMDKALKIVEIYPCKDWDTFDKILFDSFKFNALLSCLDYKEKKLLFNYLVGSMPGRFSDFLRSNKKIFKTYLKSLAGVMILNGCFNPGSDLESVCTVLDLKELGF